MVVYAQHPGQPGQSGQGSMSRQHDYYYDPPMESLRLPPMRSPTSISHPEHSRGKETVAGGGGRFHPYAVGQQDREAEPTSAPYSSTFSRAEAPSEPRHQSSMVQARSPGNNAFVQPVWSPNGHAQSTRVESSLHQTYTQQLPYRTPTQSDYDARPGKVPIASTPESLRAPSGRLKVEPRPQDGVDTELSGRLDQDHALHHLPPPVTPEDALPGEYTIQIRQQPQAARACGFGDRDRRCIDPPPILQLVVSNPNLTSDEYRSRIHYPFYVVHCTLYDATGEVDCTYMPKEFRQQKRMTGNLASGPFVAKDEFGHEGCFFPFPDLSVRTPGEYRLKFSFVMLEPQGGKVGRSYSICSTAVSNAFTVSSAKDFPGMVQSSMLAKSLKDQGYLIPIRKGGDCRASRGGRRRKGSDNGDVSGDSCGSPPRRKRKSSQ